MLDLNLACPLPLNGEVNAGTEEEVHWAAEPRRLRTLSDAEEAGDNLAFQELGSC